MTSPDTENPSTANGSAAETPSTASGLAAEDPSTTSGLAAENPSTASGPAAEDPSTASGGDEAETAPPEVGVGPHPMPWPEDPRLDPELLGEGDRRNVIDQYRYWRLEAIVEDLDTRRHGFHVAIENWEHDFNIGTVVRNANAFLAREVHVVGKRRWNRRGAMVTDRYQHLEHHPTVTDFTTWADAEELPIIGIDNVPGSVPIESQVLPERCVLVFGQEGPGLSSEMMAAASTIVAITQYGSTRSINAGVASGIAMYHWAQTWAEGGKATTTDEVAP